MVISRIGVLSLGKVCAALYGLLGLLIGAIFALISLVGIGAMAASDEPHAGIFGAMFGVGAIILFPLMYAVGGFIGGLIMAAFYNLVSGMVGGLEVDAR